ncbi:MAG TPA: TadE/TadG family type IV pilus assembly protein [Gaiellaceae bacterium]|nr:TadE/TadG family type IV pilus assembly protein [Gaiellaceae bacterium]
MTEFALVLPILALLLFGVIQFGITFNNYLTLTDAVRAGARKGAVVRNVTGNREAVVRQAVVDASTDLEVSSLNVTVSVSPGWEQGADVTVTATYPYSINLLGVGVKSGRLSSSTTERVE